MLTYKIALTLLPKIGVINGKKLIAYCGGIQEAFSATKSDLLKIPGISIKLVRAILDDRNKILERAEKEAEFVRKNEIQAIFYLDKEYPQRLKQCEDSPLLLYYKGNADLNKQKIISIVGTRTPSEYGKTMVAKIVKDLAKINPLIVSGLAYGIDITSHKAALKNNLETVGVLGSSLDWIYPKQNESIALEMIQKGGLLSEFMSKTKPDRQNFPMRNRIVAGMSDLTLVIESGAKGGSLITAKLAFDYNRDVMALPGKAFDKMSAGCNWLIKKNMATLIESGKDILELMNWEDQSKKTVQRSIFVEVNAEERTIMDCIPEQESKTIDTISIESGFPMSKTSSLLLSLEFKGLLKALPGKAYQRIS